MEVIVNGHTVSSGNKTQLYRPGEVVVDKCFTYLNKIEVRNPTEDGWTGYVSVSNDGGASYRPLLDCPTCVLTGGAENSGMIGVDGNDDMRTNIACIDGATCELLLRPGLHILSRILLSMCVYALMKPLYLVLSHVPSGMPATTTVASNLTSAQGLACDKSDKRMLA